METKEKREEGTMETRLQEELNYRAAKGQYPVTLKELESRLATLGYCLDRDMDCRHNALYVAGKRAGKSYPRISTGLKELDTGVSFFRYKDARRDKNFEAVQALRSPGKLFAVVRGAILEI